MLGGGPFPRRSTSLLVRPRLGPLRSYLRPRSAAVPGAAPEMARARRPKTSRKSNGLHKMDSVKKRTPDYTDIAYREAVARLRYLLAESYSSPQATPTKIPHVHMTKAEDSGDETDASMVMSERSRHIPYRAPYFGSKRALYSESLPKLSQTCSTLNVQGMADTIDNSSKAEGQHPPPELMAFIERQEEYIEQLEKESQYCREELSNLLGRVKDVISENEGLHEREKSGLLKSVFDCFESGDEDDQDMEQDKQERRKSQPFKKKRLEGPSIIFESRISELEAQLTQTKIDMRKAQEEADMYKKKLSDQPHSSELSSLPNVESYRQQIDTLLREKEDLTDKLAKLSAAVTQIREKEADASHKVKRSLDVVDQAQFEKAQADLEVRRLKDELDRQHEKLRDVLQEQGRRVVEERTQAERRYAQQVEQLSAELTVQWDAASKLQLELEKQRRTETDLRRELQQKSATIEELKKELQTKIAGLQSEVAQSAAERGSLEQELAAGRLTSERTERDARQESARLQAEVTALRQRLDRTDSDLMHSRRENLRLSEQVAALEREVSLAKMIREGSGQASSDGPKSNGSPSKHREKELSSMIMDMEAKHVQTVAELESMIQSQNQVVEKLKDECHSLTEKLEDSSARHKQEMAGLQSNIDYLNSKLEVSFEAQEWRDNTYVEEREPGSEHGFEFKQQQQPPDYESQPEYDSQQPVYSSQQPAFESQQPQYDPQLEYESQPIYDPQQPIYESQPIYEAEPERQPSYESQSRFDSQESSFVPQPAYEPQPDFGRQSSFGQQSSLEPQSISSPQSGTELRPNSELQPVQSRPGPESQPQPRPESHAPFAEPPPPQSTEA